MNGAAERVASSFIILVPLLFGLCRSLPRAIAISELIPFLGCLILEDQVIFTRLIHSFPWVKGCSWDQLMGEDVALKLLRTSDHNSEEDENIS